MCLPCQDNAEPMRDFGDKIFFSGPPDGFGSRLSSMVDAIWLAGQFSGRFRFHWRNQGQSSQETAVLPRREIFSGAYLRAFHVDIDLLQRQAIKPLHTLRGKLTDAFDRVSGIDGFMVTWALLRHQAPDLAALVPIDSDRRAAFASIGFSPPLAHARALAAAAPIPDGSAALHLRAGDVVYGEYRASGTNHARVIPYPLALRTMRRMAAQGVPLVVFGEDRALCEHARRAHGAILAMDLAAGHGFTSTQQALFDIALMARCNPIHAGNSAFAVTAAKIGGIALRDPMRGIAPAALVDLVHRHLRAPGPGFSASPLQRAMAAWHAVAALRHDAADPICREMMAEAIRQDPANPYYRLVEALAHYAADAPAEGEATLLDAFMGETTATNLLRHMITRLPHAPALNDRGALALLEGFARAGRPVAALLLALHARVAGMPEAAVAYRALFQANRSAGMPDSPEAVLARMRQ